LFEFGAKRMGGLTPTAFHFRNDEMFEGKEFVEAVAVSAREIARLAEELAGLIMVAMELMQEALRVFQRFMLDTGALRQLACLKKHRFGLAQILVEDNETARRLAQSENALSVASAAGEKLGAAHIGIRVRYVAALPAYIGKELKSGARGLEETKVERAFR